MTLGNVVAIVQRDIKRMLAYSGIAHMGYAMVAIIVAGVGRRRGGAGVPRGLHADEHRRLRRGRAAVRAGERAPPDHRPGGPGLDATGCRLWPSPSACSRWPASRR